MQGVHGQRSIQTDHLCGLGYVRGPSSADELFPAGFRDFDEFCAALRSHYRYKIHRSQRKFAAAGFRVAHSHGAEALPHYTDEVHQLYLAVHERAEVKLETLPAEFFRQWAVRCGGTVRLTAVFQGERIVAFAWGVFAGQSYQNVFIGLDYALNDEYDLYFNLMASDLDAALRCEAEIQVGSNGRRVQVAAGLLPPAAIRLCQRHAMVFGRARAADADAAHASAAFAAGPRLVPTKRAVLPPGRLRRQDLTSLYAIEGEIAPASAVQRS